MMMMGHGTVIVGGEVDEPLALSLPEVLHRAHGKRLS